MQIESRTTGMASGYQAGSVPVVAPRRRSDTSDPGSGAKSVVTPKEPSAAQAQAHASASKQDVDFKITVEKLNRLVQNQRKDVDISVDEEANATVIKIFKHDTGELVTQFPPEEILAMKAKLRELTGWFIDTTA